MAAQVQDIPTDPIHQMLAEYQDHYQRARSHLSKEQQELIRRVFRKSHSTQRDVETIVSELPPHERLEWQVMAHAFAQALAFLRKQGRGA